MVGGVARALYNLQILFELAHVLQRTPIVDVPLKPMKNLNVDSNKNDNVCNKAQGTRPARAKPSYPDKR